jgi:N-acetylglucosamine-6-phosphate deacetylase
MDRHRRPPHSRSRGTASQQANSSSSAKQQQLGSGECAIEMDGMDQQVGGLMRVTNGQILQDGEFVEGDLWVDLDSGKFVPPPAAEGAELPDIMGLDCKGLLVAPGFIDIQNNGSFGVDLSLPGLTAADVQKFRLQLLQHGVTSVCPTVVTSDPGTYREVLGLIGGAAGSAEDGVSVLGAHLEGPFIDAAKKGAHKEDFVQAPTAGFQSLLDAYGETAPFSLSFCANSDHLTKTGSGQR